MANLDGSSAQAIISHSLAYNNASVVKIGESGDNQDIAVAFVPTSAGRQILSLKKFVDEYNQAPERIEGVAQLASEQSFIDHVNRFKRPASAVFMKDPCETNCFAQLTAVYDFHDVEKMPADNTDSVLEWRRDFPAFGRHRAVWDIETSAEWRTWYDANGVWKQQADFAEFLEENVADVYSGTELSPTTAALIDMLELKLAKSGELVQLSRNMAVNVNANVQNAQTLSSGEIKLIYAEQHTDGAGAPLRVSNAFLIAIPVIDRGPRYQMLVRLRYRVAGPRVSWSFLLHRADLVMDAAHDEIVDRVRVTTQLPFFRGAPE